MSSTTLTHSPSSSSSEQKTWVWNDELKRSLLAYNNRIDLVGIGKLILSNQNCDLLLHRFTYFMEMIPYQEVNPELDRLAAPLLDKKTDELTARENLFLGFYHMVIKRELLSPTEKKKGFLSESLFTEKTKEKWLKIKKYFLCAANQGDEFAKLLHYQLTQSSYIKTIIKDMESIALESKIVPALTIQAASSSDPIVAQTLLKQAAGGGDPEAMYTLAKKLLDSNPQSQEGQHWMCRSLENGYNGAVFFVAQQFENQKKIEIAMLFYRALVKHMVRVRATLQDQFLSLSFTNVTKNYVVAYHLCREFLFSEDKNSSNKAKQILTFMFSDNEIVTLLKNQIDNFEEDLQRCGEDIVALLEKSTEVVTLDCLNAAVKESNLILLKKVMRTLEPTPDKNKILADVLLNLIDHCQEVDVVRSNPLHDLEMALWLLNEGAEFSRSRKNNSNILTSEAKTTSIAMRFFSNLDIIMLPKRELNQIYYQTVITLLLQLLSMPLQMDDLYQLIIAHSKILPILFNINNKYEYEEYNKKDQLGFQISGLALTLFNAPKKLYVGKLYKESIHNMLVFPNLTSNILRDIPKNELIDILIALSSTQIPVRMDFNLIDPIILREMSIEKLQDWESMRGLLNYYLRLRSNEEHVVWISYHAAMKILHTLKPDHRCYREAAATIESLLLSQPHREHLEKAKAMLVKDIEQCEISLAVLCKKLMLNEGSLDFELERAIESAPSNLLDDKLDVQQAEIQKIKNDIARTSQVSKLEELKNSLHIIQESKNYLLYLAIQRLSRTLEEEPTKPAIQNSLNKINLLIRNDSDVNVNFKGVSVLNKLLSEMEKINKDFYLPSANFLFDFILKQTLSKTTRCKVIEIVLSMNKENFRPETILLAIDSYYAVTRQPTMKALTEGKLKTQCDSILIARMLTLFINYMKSGMQELFISRIYQIFQKDLLKVSHQDFYKLLQLAFSKKDIIFNKLIKLMIIQKPVFLKEIAFDTKKEFLQNYCSCRNQVKIFLPIKQLLFLLNTLRANNIKDTLCLNQLMVDIISLDSFTPENLQDIADKHFKQQENYHLLHQVFRQKISLFDSKENKLEEKKSTTAENTVKDQYSLPAQLALKTSYY